MKVTQEKPLFVSSTLFKTSKTGQYISNSDRLHVLRQQTQAMQKQYESDENHFLTVSQIVDQSLENLENIDPNLKQSKKIFHLKEKLKKIRRETKEKEEAVTQTDLAYENAMKIAGEAINQANQEIQKTKQMRDEQENINQVMIAIHHDLNKIVNQTMSLKEKQTVLSQEVNDIQETFDNHLSDLNSVSPKIDIVSADISQIKLNHKKIDQQFDKLKGKIQKVGIQQEQIESKIDGLIDKNLHSQMSGKSIDKNEMIQNFLKIKWQYIKNYGNFIVAYSWENFTYAGSKITLIAQKFISEQVISRSKQVVKDLTGIVWTYIKNNTLLLTWIALGVFTASCIPLSIKHYPMLSLFMGGCLFIVARNFVMPMVNFLKD